MSRTHYVWGEYSHFWQGAQLQSRDAHSQGCVHSDTVQLASALRAQSNLGIIEGPPVVFAADDRLMDAAQAEGLKTANPNHY